MPSVPTLVNVLAGVTKAVALLNCDPDCQAAALQRLEKRQVSLSNQGLLVDLRGVWLYCSFLDWFWHGSVSKFRGRERDLVVAVAKRALHRLHYVLGSLEVPGTLLGCFSLTAYVLVSLRAGSPVGHGVAGSASPDVSDLLCDTFDVTPRIAPPLPPWWIPGRAFRSVRRLRRLAPPRPRLLTSRP